MHNPDRFDDRYLAITIIQFFQTTFVSKKFTFRRGRAEGLAFPLASVVS